MSGGACTQRRRRRGAADGGCAAFESAWLYPEKAGRLWVGVCRIWLCVCVCVRQKDKVANGEMREKTVKYKKHAEMKRIGRRRKYDSGNNSVSVLVNGKVRCMVGKRLAIFREILQIYSEHTRLTWHQVIRCSLSVPFMLKAMCESRTSFFLTFCFRGMLVTPEFEKKSPVWTPRGHFTHSSDKRKPSK